MNISIDVIKEFRSQTGAGVSEAKKVLEEAGGDIAKAVQLLRSRGKKMMESKAGRATREGYIGSYVHSTGKIGALVEIQCETDFVSRSDVFRELARNLAMHVAAAAPKWVNREEVDPNEKAQEEAIYREQLKAEGKPVEMLEKILPGKMEKFYQQVVLLDQPYIRDDAKTINNLLQEATQQLGENIQLKRFIRLNID